MTAGHYVAVAWDLDTTGRKLIDEICQIGGHFLGQVRDETKEDEENTFSQYVMPHRNPNPGARRSFGIKVIKSSIHSKLHPSSSSCLGCEHREVQDAERSEHGENFENKVRSERLARLHLLAWSGQRRFGWGHSLVPRAGAEGAY